MRLLPTLAALLLLTTPALADGTADAERKELEEDICYESRLLDQRRYEFRQEQNEFQRADPMGNLPKSLQAKGDENVLRGQRIGQLCERYEKKYGERPPGGCCGVETALTRELKAVQDEAREEAAEIAKLAPPDRAEPCGAFKQRWKWMPSACDNVPLPPPVVRYPPN